MGWQEQKRAWQRYSIIMQAKDQAESRLNFSKKCNRSACLEQMEMSPEEALY